MKTKKIKRQQQVFVVRHLDNEEIRHTIEIRGADVEKADFLYNVNHCYAKFISKCQATQHRRICERTTHEY